jgi:addiction module RelE/StbE family toxin
MKKSDYKIVWTDEAKADLKDIYNFIKKKSSQGAKNVISDIRNAPKSVYFPHQNQDELYNNQYMRIVVRDYKILYKTNEQSDELIIYAIFDTRQDPYKLSEIKSKSPNS